MKVLIAAVGSVLVLVATAAPVHAGKKHFISVINGGQEVPSNAVNGQGVAFLTFDPDTDMLCYSITYSGLTGTEQDGHIHGPASPGVDASILFSIVPPLSSPKNGCVGPLTNDNASALKKGQLYLNIHTDLFPGGELRGQIIPVKVK